MLQVFSINVYSLLDPNYTFSFVTPLVAMKLDVIPNVLEEPFSVSTPVGDSLLLKDSMSHLSVKKSHIG